MEARYDDYPLPRRESAANREIKLSFVGSRINAKLTSGTREIDGNQFNVSIQRSILFTRAGAYSTEKPDAYVLTFDITDRASFNSVSKIVADITKENPSKPIILVGVNNHLRQAAHVTNAQGQELANKIGAAKYIECNINDPEKLAEVINAAVRATSHALPITTRQAAQSNVISLNPASAPDQAHRPLESNNSGRVDTENEWLTTIITTLNKKPLADRPLLLNQMAKSFADSAREAVTPEEKERIFNALQALKLANAITSAELEETQEQQAQSINRTPATASSSATPQNVDTADATMRAYQQQQEKLAQLQKMRVEGKLTPEQERALAVFEQKQAQQAGTTIPTSSGSNHSQSRQAALTPAQGRALLQQLNAAEERLERSTPSSSPTAARQANPAESVRLTEADEPEINNWLIKLSELDRHPSEKLLSMQKMRKVLTDRNNYITRHSQNTLREQKDFLIIMEAINRAEAQLRAKLEAEANRNNAANRLSSSATTSSSSSRRASPTAADIQAIAEAMTSTSSGFDSLFTSLYEQSVQQIISRFMPFTEPDRIQILQKISENIHLYDSTELNNLRIRAMAIIIHIGTGRSSADLGQSTRRALFTLAEKAREALHNPSRRATETGSNDIANQRTAVSSSQSEARQPNPVESVRLTEADEPEIIRQLAFINRDLLSGNISPSEKLSRLEIAQELLIDNYYRNSENTSVDTKGLLIALEAFGRAAQAIREIHRPNLMSAANPAPSSSPSAAATRPSHANSRAPQTADPFDADANALADVYAIFGSQAEIDAAIAAQRMHDSGMAARRRAGSQPSNAVVNTPAPRQSTARPAQAQPSSSSVPSSSVPSVSTASSTNYRDYDTNTTIKGSLNGLIETVLKYSNKSTVLLREVCKAVKKDEREIAKVVDLAFSGRNLPQEDRESLVSELQLINNLANGNQTTRMDARTRSPIYELNFINNMYDNSPQSIRLQGQYSSDDLFRMVKEAVLESIAEKEEEKSPRR